MTATNKEELEHMPIDKMANFRVPMLFVVTIIHTIYVVRSFATQYDFSKMVNDAWHPL